MKAFERLTSALPALRWLGAADPVPVRRIEPPTFFDTFDGLHHAVDDLLGRFDGESGDTVASPTSGQPRWTIAEDDDGYEVRIELPISEPEEVEVSLMPDRLIVAGAHRREPRPLWRWWRSNGELRSESRFRLDVTTPAAVDGDAAFAELRHGSLRVRLPKKAGAERRVRVPLGG